MSAANVFAIPPGADFAAEFADGYHRRCASLPMAVQAETIVFVNTARAFTDLQTALADRADGPCILPRFILIQDLADDSILNLQIPPSVPATRRHLTLIRLVEAFLINRQSSGAPVAPTTAAPDMAEALGFLIDQFHDSGISEDSLNHALRGFDLQESSANHWQDLMRFIDIVRQEWPKARAEHSADALDAREQQRRAVAVLTDRWAVDPPKMPVLVAGSTGSVASTADLMAAVARLPKGMVVLPGFTPEIEPEIWERSGPDHPVGPFKMFMDKLDLLPSDIRVWHESDQNDRRDVLNQALRPAPVTDAWHSVGATLKERASTGTTSMSLIEAPSPRHEASAIAVAAREALECPGERVTVITPDAELARQVAVALERFGITADDTIGRPLSASPPGVLMQLILAVAEGSADSVAISAFLQHPLMRGGMDRAAHLGFGRRYEMTVLRGRETHTVAAVGRLPPLPADLPSHDELAAWLSGINGALAPMADALKIGAPLSDLLTIHSAAARQLTDPANGMPPEAFQQDTGEALDRFLEDVMKHADAFGDARVNDYRTLLTGLMRGQQLRPRPREAHRRVAIVGIREARLENAETVIVAGLNDGQWPAAPDPGPWLSRPMYAALGLPMPERTIGLAAHDFLQAACRPKVVLSRSVRADGAPTVASRWLVRLETLLTGIGAAEMWSAMQGRGQRYLALGRMDDVPETSVPRAERPRPVPPRHAIPDRLSVTQIETLVRDAYAVYARHILKLRPVEPLGRRPDARERGTVLHEILESFIRQSDPWPGRDIARDLLGKIADDKLAEADLPPDLMRIWRSRVERFADWFLKQEDARRQTNEPMAVEVPGEMAMRLPGGDFTISAKADRIDRLPGGAAIYDYKTGAPPREK
ncbi:MAG: double-strand break repair protein AddB, partial [Pseudomonadota bacterium]